MNLAGMALSKPKAKKQKPKMMGMHVQKGASGGYVARHDMDDGSSQTHAIPNMKALKQHMMDNMAEEMAEQH